MTTTFEAFLRLRVKRQRGKRALLSKFQGWDAEMPRARLLKPGFFANEALADIHPFGRLLFAGLWTLADREGRLNDRPKWIKGALFPYENVQVEKLLGDLEGAGFIMRYEVEGERYIQVVKFTAHQHVHKNETESVIPSPFGPKASDALVRNAPVIGDTSTDIVETAPAEASSTPTPTPKAEASPKAEATSRREDIKARLNFTDEDWRDVIAKHPGVNVHARFWDFVDWIGGSEGVEFPSKPVNAFHGFLRNNYGASKSSGGGGVLREVKAVYG